MTWAFSLPESSLVNDSGVWYTGRFRTAPHLHTRFSKWLWLRYKGLLWSKDDGIQSCGSTCITFSHFHSECFLYMLNYCAVNQHHLIWIFYFEELTVCVITYFLLVFMCRVSRKDENQPFFCILLSCYSYSGSWGAWPPVFWAAILLPLWDPAVGCLLQVRGEKLLYGLP